MKGVWPGLLAVVLCGCQPSAERPQATPQPVATSGTSFCYLAAEALNDPSSNETTRAMAWEMARNRGCFGRPQPITIDQNVTVRTVP